MQTDIVMKTDSSKIENENEKNTVLWGWPENKMAATLQVLAFKS